MYHRGTDDRSDGNILGTELVNIIMIFDTVHSEMIRTSSYCIFLFLSLISAAMRLPTRRPRGGHAEVRTYFS